MLTALIVLLIIVGIFFLMYFSYQEKQEYNKQNSDYPPDGFRNIKDSSKNMKNRLSNKQRNKITRFR